MNPIFKTWLKTGLTATIILIVTVLGLPSLLLLFKISSFDIGQDSLWLMKWQSDASGSDLQFNWPLALAAASLAGISFLLYRLWRSRRHPKVKKYPETPQEATDL